MVAYDENKARAFGEGIRTDVGALSDVQLGKWVAEYKRFVASRYRSVGPNEKDRLPSGPVYVSPKIDGQFWCLLLDGQDATLINPRGRIMTGALPLLNEARAAMGGSDERLLIAGELHVERDSGRARVRDVAAAVGEGDAERLRFAAFDLVRVGDASMATTPYADRLEKLQALIGEGSYVTVVETRVVNDAEAILSLFDEWAGEGRGEGIILRALDGRVYKMKPSFTLDAAVIGYTTRVDLPGQARSLLLALMREDGLLQVVGSCGNLGDEDARKAILASLEGTETPSTYRYASSSGALFQFVTPKLVVEVRVNDVQSLDSSDAPVTRMVLEFSEGMGYRTRRPMAGVSLYHPVLERVRDDKAVNADDVRVAQVLERVHVEAMNASAEVLSLPASEVLRREVYEQHKGEKHGVRKLLLWATNKAEIDPSYPPFVVQWTDYSSGRKDPLKREVRLAQTREAADAIAEEMLKAGVKRGWAKVE